MDRPSERLAALAADLTEDRPAVGALLERLGQGGTGVVLLVLSLPAIVPTPGLPVGMVFGTALVLVALQMMVGRDPVVLPGSIRRATLPRPLVSAAAGWLAARLRPLEALLAERLAVLTGPAGRRVAGLCVLLMGVAIMLPIPFGNLAPALAVVATAVALIVRDGLLMALAYGAVAAAAGATVWLAVASLDLAARLLG